MLNIKRNETEPKYPLYIPEARSFAALTDSSSSLAPFTPEEIENAYALKMSASAGEGITVAVIDAYNNDNVAEDFARFGQRFGLPENELEIHFPDGRNTVTTGNWSLEASTDTQWVYAVAPAAKIMCVFSRDAKLPSLFSAVNYAVNMGADIISMSFGSSEFAGEQDYTQYMKDTKKIFVASSGDVGGAVFFPSASDAVVSVGGTVLHRTDNGKVFARSAWRNGGGGPSVYTGIPDWQRRFSGITELAGEKRAIPDVALDASVSPGYAVYNTDAGGWVSVGGTSVSAPVFAGICARLKQNDTDIDGTNIHSFLYNLAGGTEYAEPQHNYYDITVGNNGRYSAGFGFDLCTGLGSLRLQAKPVYLSKLKSLRT